MIGMEVETASEPSVPPALMIFLRLAQNATFAIGFNLQEIAMHRAHPVIEAFSEVIDLSELLR